MWCGSTRPVVRSRRLADAGAPRESRALDATSQKCHPSFGRIAGSTIALMTEWVCVAATRSTSVDGSGCTAGQTRRGLGRRYDSWISRPVEVDYQLVQYAASGSLFRDAPTRRPERT